MLKSTDKDILARKHYADSSKLAVRKRFGRLSNPPTTFEGDIIDFLLEKRPARVLDAGCGNGDLLAKLRKRGFGGELHGIDISDGMIREAKARSEKENAHIHFQVADAQDIPFESGFFDAIICKHMLYHVPNPQKAVDEFYRCLTPKGALIITLNSIKNKPQFFHCEEMVCRKHSVKSADHGQQFVNVENVGKYLERFSRIDTAFKEGKVNAPELFVAYFDSMRDNFEPEPSDALWKKIVEDVARYVEENKRNGFVETNVVGMTTATK